MKWYIKYRHGQWQQRSHLGVSHPQEYDQYPGGVQ